MEYLEQDKEVGVHPYEEHTAQLKNINSSIMKGVERIAKVEASQKTQADELEYLNKRLDARENELKVIERLAFSIESLSKDVGTILEKMDANNLDQMSKDISGLQTDVVGIKDTLIILQYRPERKISEYVQEAIRTLITLAVGFLFAKYMK